METLAINVVSSGAENLQGSLPNWLDEVIDECRMSWFSKNYWLAGDSWFWNGAVMFVTDVITAQSRKFQK